MHPERLFGLLATTSFLLFRFLSILSSSDFPLERKTHKLDLFLLMRFADEYASDEVLILPKNMTPQFNKQTGLCGRFRYWLPARFPPKEVERPT
jgi:hypothetical protein